eukprot:TRINITY_DN8638_c0_g2_i6.p2 TRINITY_DN8638_c0_g2~~TRINITY_DN8638_c0_g2_i6.p2  ORF type:complete len:110 (+),score=5.66 TRINITY_DN8638_c0_g2_i6:156-485(+)
MFIIVLSQNVLFYASFGCFILSRIILAAVGNLAKIYVSFYAMHLHRAVVIFVLVITLYAHYFCIFYIIFINNFETNIILEGSQTNVQQLKLEAGWKLAKIWVGRPGSPD